MNSKIKNFIKELIPYVIIFVVVVLIRTFIATLVLVNGESMKPTLDGGELMIETKVNKDYKRFDVVVIYPNNDKKIIKRIIALPGEKIACENGKLYLNGRLLEENYSTGVTSDFKAITLGKDEYFVLGDNRENSKDSRFYGPFKKDEIKGKSEFILFPFSKIGNINK